MLRALKDRDAARGAYRAGRIEGDVRLAATEMAYTNAVKQYREIQRERLVAGIVIAVACGALGCALGLPALAVAILFLGSVGVAKLLTL
jgi:hypothetical protein